MCSRRTHQDLPQSISTISTSIQLLNERMGEGGKRGEGEREDSNWWRNRNWFTVFHGFDTAWVGYRMMQGHSVLTHLQMEVCSSAQYVCYLPSPHSFSPPSPLPSLPSLSSLPPLSSPLFVSLSLLGQIIVNAYGPTWLLDGIMAMRTMQQSSVASASFD